jgi:hypothetical protein
MIIDFISSVALGIATWIVSLAPNMTSADYGNIDSITAGIQFIIDNAHKLDFFIPVASIVYIVWMVISIELMYFIIRVTRWIASIVTIGFVK